MNEMVISRDQKNEKMENGVYRNNKILAKLYINVVPKRPKSTAYVHLLPITIYIHYYIKCLVHSL